MRLNKPIKDFTEEEVKDICKFIRLFPSKDETKECTYGFITCHFADGKFCNRKPIKDWNSKQ